MTVCAPWITEAHLTACGCPSDAPAGVVSSSIDYATGIIYALTGHQFPGECEETVYPCPNRGGYWRLNPDPVWTPLGETWPNVSSTCLDTNGCRCDGVAGVRFDRDRIIEITAVVIGETTLDPSAYRLDVDRLGYSLVRIDGDRWPCNNSIGQPVPAVGAWSVTYTYGQNPPSYVANAAAELATEFIKGCVGDSTCRIPNRATTVTTEGVTYALLDPQEFITAGRTGIYAVDLAIRAANPGGVFRRARIISPESVSNRRIVPTGS